MKGMIMFERIVNIDTYMKVERYLELKELMKEYKEIENDLIGEFAGRNVIINKTFKITNRVVSVSTKYGKPIKSWKIRIVKVNT